MKSQVRSFIERYFHLAPATPNALEKELLDAIEKDIEPFGQFLAANYEVSYGDRMTMWSNNDPGDDILHTTQEVFKQFRKQQL